MATTDALGPRTGEVWVSEGRLNQVYQDPNSPTGYTLKTWGADMAPVYSYTNKPPADVWWEQQGQLTGRQAERERQVAARSQLVEDRNFGLADQKQRLDEKEQRDRHQIELDKIRNQAKELERQIGADAAQRWKWEQEVRLAEEGHKLDRDRLTLDVIKQGVEYASHPGSWAQAADFAEGVSSSLGPTLSFQRLLNHEAAPSFMGTPMVSPSVAGVGTVVPAAAVGTASVLPGTGVPVTATPARAAAPVAGQLGVAAPAAAGAATQGGTAALPQPGNLNSFAALLGGGYQGSAEQARNQADLGAIQQFLGSGGMGAMTTDIDELTPSAYERLMGGMAKYVNPADQAAAHKRSRIAFGNPLAA